MGESDGSSVVSNDVRDLLLAEALLYDLQELETGLLLVNLVRNESTLDVIENSEMFIGFFNCNNVHLSERESVVSPDFAVDLDEALLILHDLSGLISAGGVLKSLLEEHVQGNALSELMGSGGWSGSVHTLKLSKVPLLGSSHSLYNLSLSFIALNNWRSVRIQRMAWFESASKQRSLPF